MKKERSFKKIIKMTVLKSMAAIAGCMMLVYPWMDKLDAGESSDYYRVVLNQQEIGGISDKDSAVEVLKRVRLQMTREAGSLVYMEPELVVTKENKLFGTRMTEDELEKAMYAILENQVTLPESTTYTLKIDENMIYLSSREEVVSLLEGVKNRFDAEQEFSVELIENEQKEFTSLTTKLVRADRKARESNPVAATGEEETAEVTDTAVEPQEFREGLIDVDFEQDILITESNVPAESCMSVAEALDMLTRDKEENQIYEVISGDCMSVIAEKNEIPLSRLYNLNENVTEETQLQIGQELIITVPEPELSVLAREEVTYEEEYQAETVYVDNDSWYTTETVVRQEGTAGYHEVVAIVNTRNGKEVDREIIHETVMVESQPTIIERGTQTPPTYIWPTYNHTITSYFGQRWGRSHDGLDIGVSSGTTVMASSAGTVVSAGWNGGYGNCILIRHPDGRQTRYAHLNKILVSVGESVSQGEKIALSGNTGRSTGDHLHFEIIINGNAVNPLDYIGY